MKNTEFATTLRGIAALCVIISHYFGLFWVNQAAVSELIRSPAVDGLWLPSYLMWLHPHPLFNWGAFGVALFFLVSGFVIPYSLERSSRLQFIIGRIFRIMPVYAAGFSITIISIFVSVKYFDAQWPFTAKQVFIHYIPGIRDILNSVNIDGIVWTLETEMKFYFICLLGVSALQRRSLAFFVIPFAVALISFLLIHNVSKVYENGNYSAYWLMMALIDSAPYLVFMFIGSVFHYAYNNYINAERSIFLVASLFVLHLVIMWSGPFSSRLISSPNYGLAILIFAFAMSFPNLFRSSKIGDFFARISYPLYAIHGIAGYVMLRILLDWHVPAWACLIIVTGSAIVSAWVIHFAIEKPGIKIGKIIAKRFKPRGPSTPVFKDSDKVPLPAE
ncbi:peptidoglycan/LPS O-acetylase OafA/YrhL [Ochrobactrum sp. 19YEA23]|uniref:acyltransferase family protein n=1 Tax=Ochrobactrum sp. 19YEA23 TaxID=3039854 RepID=UPI00247AF6CD|nr:peptidoglycan/LPS O-acetylase OafA/YrhL [Ochrobactrum sp. 19YEA23]